MSYKLSVILILVLLAFIGSYQVFGRSIEQVGCEYKAISEEYTESCKRTYVDDIFKNVLNDGIIRGNELLEQLSSTCRNYESYSKCTNCTARHVCPEERTKFIKSLNEKWALFCDADRPAEWLKTILQNGYSYNQTCDYVYKEAFFPCLVAEERDYNATSLTHVLEDYRSFISNTFKCSIGGILSFGHSVRQCGSSWQDILLTQWLKISAGYSFGVNINEDEVKILQAMRC